MTEKRPFVLIVIIAGMILLCCNMFIQSRLDNSIRENKLINEQFVEGAPPLVAFTTMALGGFRGIIADALWFRAVTLQDQGKYFEMVQLASWIMKLQPKSTATASYLAWNMAYNISVTHSLPEDRWRWVNKGIELYHEALQYNPNDPTLYKELGWIYQHKLGNILDDAQRYYKWQMASAMITILGKHYPDWQVLADAPQTEKDFLAKVKNPKKMLAAIAAGYEAGIPAVFKKFKALNGVIPDDLQKSMEKEDLAVMENYFRSRWLYERFMLRADKILAINTKYGELDWFLPESFAIYWAEMGTEKSPSRQNVDCDRMISQSMQVTFTNGRMLYPGAEPSIDFMLIPNLAVADTVRGSYLRAIKQNPDVISFVHAYQNFMSRAILTMFSYGYYSKAQEFHKILRKEYPGYKRNISFEQFVYNEWQEEMKSIGYKQAQDLIGGMIMKACMLQIYGDQTAAESQMRLAELCYNRYNKDRPEKRVQLLPFQRMKSEIAKTIMKNIRPDLAIRLKAFTAYEAQQNEEKAKEEQTVTVPQK